jgi:hypothetical protein
MTIKSIKLFFIIVINTYIVIGISFRKINNIFIYLLNSYNFSWNIRRSTNFLHSFRTNSKSIWFFILSYSFIKHIMHKLRTLSLCRRYISLNTNRIYMLCEFLHNQWFLNNSLVPVLMKPYLCSLALISKLLHILDKLSIWSRVTILSWFEAYPTAQEYSCWVF